MNCPHCHAAFWEYHTLDIEDVLEPLWVHCRECGYEEELAEE